MGEAMTDLATQCFHRLVDCWYAPPYIEVECAICGRLLDPTLVSLDLDRETGEQVLWVDGSARDIRNFSAERRQ